jgi:hypothetical protein
MSITQAFRFYREKLALKKAEEAKLQTKAAQANAQGLIAPQTGENPVKIEEGATHPIKIEPTGNSGGAVLGEPQPPVQIKIEDVEEPGAQGMDVEEAVQVKVEEGVGPGTGAGAAAGGSGKLLAYDPKLLELINFAQLKKNCLENRNPGSGVQ